MSLSHGNNLHIGVKTMRLAKPLVVIAALTLPGVVAAETVVYTGMNTTATDYIYRNGSYFGNYYAGEMGVTINGESNAAYCVDLDHYVYAGRAYTANLVDARTHFDYDQACTMNYILGNFDAVDNASGAAIQIAMWKTVYGPENLQGTTYEAAAQAVYDEAFGNCPLWCDADIEMDVVFEATADGLFATLTVLDGGAPVVGQLVDVAATDGSVLTDMADWYTDAAGELVLELDMSGTTMSLDFYLGGSTLYVLDPDPSYQQLLAYTYETCDWDTSATYDPIPLGDPNTIGFWKHQVKEKGHIHVDRATIEGWLPAGIFTDFTVADFDAAYDALWVSKATMQQRAQQQCLATYFNLMYGQVGWYTDLGGQYFYELWDGVQADYDAGDYEAAKDACDAFNNL
jgi:hypothetical protein